MAGLLGANPASGLLAESPREYTHRLLMSKLPNAHPNTVAGIMGNIDVETGGTYDPDQKQVGGGHGFGLFQFDYKGGKKGTGMRGSYESWLSDNKRTNNAESQIDFMVDAIYNDKPYYEIGRGHQLKLREAFENGDPADVAKQFLERFEKAGTPHLKRRLGSAITQAADYNSNLLGL